MDDSYKKTSCTFRKFLVTPKYLFFLKKFKLNAQGKKSENYLKEVNCLFIFYSLMPLEAIY